MKLSVLKENFAAGLSVVGKAVATKGSLPILSNVLIETEEGRLKLAATDLETGVVTWIGAKIEEEGGVTVPARLLLEFVGNLPPVELKLSSENQIFTISAEKSHSTFNGVSKDEFPSLPKTSSEYFLKVNPKDFSGAVSEVAFAASSDETRPILTGVLMKVSGNTLTFVGVDGFRLAERVLMLSETVKEDVSLVIPSKTLLEVSRVVGGSEEPIKISLLPEGNQLIFEMPNVLIFSRILEGQFPEYKKIIPADFVTSATIVREELLNAVRLASVFAKDTSSIVKLHFKGSEVSLTSTAVEVGEGESTADAEITGGELEIAFNSRYLTDLLSNIKGERLTFSGNDSLSAGLFKIVGREDYLHLIMPVRFQQ